MQETITVVSIMDCPMITVHAGKCYKALIHSGAAHITTSISLLIRTLMTVPRPHSAHYSQIEYSGWSPYDSPRHDSVKFEDSRIQIHSQFCNL